MDNRITDETVEEMAALAKLELSENSLTLVRADMEQLLDYIARMEELDATNVEPLYAIGANECPLREDLITNDDGREQAMDNAPATTGELFVVPSSF